MVAGRLSPSPVSFRPAMIFRIIFFAVFLHMGYAGMRVTASLDALAIGAGAFQVGILMSLMAFFPTFLSMPFGRWMDGAGARKPLCLAIGFLGAAALIPFALPAASFGIVPLYFCCVFDGIGFMCLQMSTLQLMGFLSTPESRTNAFSWLAMAYAGSGLVSPVIAGHAIDFFSHRAAFGISLAFIALGLALFLLNLRAVPAAWGAAKERKKKKGAFDLLTIPKVRNVLLVSALISMAWELENFMFPVYGHEIGLTASEIGWLLGVFYSGTFLVRVLMPILSRRITPWQFMVLVLGLGAACYAAFPLFRTLPPLIAVAFLLGLGLGASQPNVMTLLHNQTPRGRVGEALGIRTMLRNAAHSALPVGFGVITASIGVFWIFMAQAALMAAAAVAAQFRDRTGEDDAEGEELEERRS